MNTSQGKAPAEPDLNTALNGLGPQVAHFQSDLANFLAGIILGLLSIAGGVAMIAWMAHIVVTRDGRLQWFKSRDPHDLPWFLVALLVLAGLGLVLLGRGLFLMAGRSRSFRLIVCRDGFVAVEGEQVTVFRWDDLACVVETATQEYFPLKMGLKYLFPLGRSHSYTVQRQDGVAVYLDGDVVKRLGKLRRVLWAETQRRGIVWRTEDN